MHPTTASMLGHEHEADLAREARRAALADVARAARADHPAVNLGTALPVRRLIVIGLSGAAALALAATAILH